MVTDEFLKQILKCGMFSVPALTKAINCNPNIPQNHNCKITSLTKKHGEVFNGDKWIKSNKSDIIDEVYNNKIKYITNNKDKVIETLPKSNQNAIDRMLDLDDDHDKTKEIKGKITLLLNNYSDIISKEQKNKETIYDLFIKECTTYSKNHVKTSDLYDSFIKWYKPKNPNEIISNRKFTIEIKLNKRLY